LRGAIWYQGESNAGRASEYRALFSAMITQWRQAFGQGDFPFYWVQLANFKTDKPDSGAWPLLREAQTQTLALPATGQAIAIDIGNPDDIHPRNKQEVGRRLALIAMSQAYGQTMDDSGPVFLRANPEKNRLRIEFAHAVTGLIARDKPLQSFEVAGADGVYRPATADIEGDTVVVRAAEVPAPVAVRYAWSNSPEANLFNGAGLPAVPFRSDAR
jgi:sialate O-acetylesterase